MDVFQHARPVVLFVTQRCRVDEVQQHANAAHSEADNEAPECALYDRKRQSFMSEPEREGADRHLFTFSLVLFQKQPMRKMMLTGGCR